MSMLDPKDLDLLLRADQGALLGQVMRLNREPRYHNRLDAIQLMALIKEVKRNGNFGPDNKR